MPGKNSENLNKGLPKIISGEIIVGTDPEDGTIIHIPLHSGVTEEVSGVTSIVITPVENTNNCIIHFSTSLGTTVEVQTSNDNSVVEAVRKSNPSSVTGFKENRTIN